jgi:hypothetical protein
MVIVKSFKYDPEKRPKVHEWMLALEESGKDFSESMRRLIEGDNRDREQLRQDIDILKQMVAKLQATGGQAPAQKAELLEIQEVVEGIATQPEIKQVNISAMKSRYQL